MSQTLDRDQLAALYIEQLAYEPYPVQEEALLSWFTAQQGVMVCAPTGAGKTLIAEAAMFEALHTNSRAYYTTPLIALTEQKFSEMQQAAVEWGFSANDVGLVTGNRRVNPGARVLVVVAEILFNRLLHGEEFDFSDVSSVVMDEFHSFNDPERGVVWELSLGLLPAHVRTLLLSATVGNAREFIIWLRQAHNRRIELVESDKRTVPLVYQWVGDTLLGDQIEQMADGEEASRTTPALIFCFNREQCWTVAEQLKGKHLIDKTRQAVLAKELNQIDFSQGAGPKLKQILMRGVGVHHAGVLPKYRRIVEDLFQRKMLSAAVCTETLALGVNLPARSVVLPTLMKGPPNKKRLIEPSAAHQIFGRAGRPQFDVQGHVFVLAHEDDVKMLRWREKYDAIPEDTKDAGLRKAKKKLKKKMPRRRTGEQYWTEAQFEKLKTAAPAKLASRGELPWRLLAYMLDASPEVAPVRALVQRRLLHGRQKDEAQNALDRMLLTLERAGFVELDPPPPIKADDEVDGEKDSRGGAETTGDKPLASLSDSTTSGLTVDIALSYRADFARPTDQLQRLLALRGVNPLYGVFLVNQLGIADRNERIQAFESVMDLPGSLGRAVWVPPQEELPPGPLATTRLDARLLQLGIVSAEELSAAEQEEEEDESPVRGMFAEDRPRILTLAEKLKLLFNHEFPGVHDVRTRGVWVAGEIIEFGGDFNNYITSKGLQKQEGVVFRHLLRLILLLEEMKPLTPPETTAEEWRTDLEEVEQLLTSCCRTIDSTSTDKALQQIQTNRSEERIK